MSEARHFKRVILHAGVHKTGTTAIQKALAANLDFLRERHAVLVFPNRKTVKPVVEAALAAAPFPSARKEAFLGQLLEGIGPLEPEKYTLLMSWERLAGLPYGGYPQAVERARLLADCLAGESVEIYLLLRRQDEFLESYYLETVKHRHSWSFDEYFARESEGLVWDWRRLRAAWTDAFGAEALKTRIYRKDEDPAAFVDSIFRWFSGDADWGDLSLVPERANRSLSLQGLEVMRRLNQEELPEALISEARPLVETFFPRAAGESFSLLSANQRAQLAEIYNPGNRELAEAIGEPVDLLTITSGADPVPVQSPDTVTIPVPACIRILAQDRARLRFLEQRCKELLQRLAVLEKQVEGSGDRRPDAETCD